METTTRKNRVVIVKTSDEGEKSKKAIPIELRIEITPEKELASIEARDPEENEYIVSIGLKLKKAGAGRPLCCCRNKRGKKVTCYPIPVGGKCSCRN